MDLNHRHLELQSSALPTELLNHIKWRSWWELNPRSPPWQGGILTTIPQDHIGCEGRIRTCDLWVMSPTSYQTALPRDIKNCNGGGGGIRTPASFYTPTGVQSQTLQPLGYTSRTIFILVGPAGFEPATNRLWADCSDQLS